jgi:hypothetical protein
MRATSPSGDASYEGRVQWSGELGYGIRVPEGGQSGRRDDDATGVRDMRDVYYLHLDDADRPPEMQGRRGVLNRARAKVALRRDAMARHRRAPRDASGDTRDGRAPLDVPRLRGDTEE